MVAHLRKGVEEREVVVQLVGATYKESKLVKMQSNKKYYHILEFF